MRTRTELPWPYEWRYLPNGLVRHAVNADRQLAVAMCGVDAWSYIGWYGTGEWSEIERVGALPDCQRCTRILGLTYDS